MAELWAHVERDGGVVIEGLLDRDTVAALTRDCDDALAESSGIETSRAVIPLGPADDAGRLRVQDLSDTALRSCRAFDRNSDAITRVRGSTTYRQPGTLTSAILR